MATQLVFDFGCSKKTLLNSQNISFMLLFSFTGTLQLWALTLISYYLTKFTRGKSWAPILIFVFNMAVLSANHIYNQMIKGMTSRMDHTAPMVKQGVILTILWELTMILF